MSPQLAFLSQLPWFCFAMLCNIEKKTIHNSCGTLWNQAQTSRRQLFARDSVATVRSSGMSCHQKITATMGKDIGSKKIWVIQKDSALTGQVAELWNLINSQQGLAATVTMSQGKLYIPAGHHASKSRHTFERATTCTVLYCTVVG